MYSIVYFLASLTGFHDDPIETPLFVLHPSIKSPQPASGGDSSWFWRLDGRTLACRNGVSPGLEHEVWVEYRAGETTTGGRYYLWSVGRPTWTRQRKLYFGYIDGRQYVQLVREK